MSQTIADNDLRYEPKYLDMGTLGIKQSEENSDISRRNFLSIFTQARALSSWGEVSHIPLSKRGV